MSILADSPPQRRRLVHVETRGLHKAVETHRKNLEDGLDAIVAIGDAEQGLTVAEQHDITHDSLLVEAFNVTIGAANAVHEPSRLTLRRIARYIVAAADADEREDMLRRQAAEALRERAKPPVRRINTRSDTGLRRAGA